MYCAANGRLDLSQLGKVQTSKAPLRTVIPK